MGEIEATGPAEPSRVQRAARLVPVAIAAALLAACAGSGGGYSPRAAAPAGTESFQAGYWHGCRTGVLEAYSFPDTHRMEARYRNDEQYRSGFDTGYALCLEHERKYPKIHNEPMVRHGGARAG